MTLRIRVRRFFIDGLPSDTAPSPVRYKIPPLRSAETAAAKFTPFFLKETDKRKQRPFAAVQQLKGCCFAVFYF
jgi:hypothetical protein